MGGYARLDYAVVGPAIVGIPVLRATTSSVARESAAEQPPRKSGYIYALLRTGIRESDTRATFVSTPMAAASITQLV